MAAILVLSHALTQANPTDPSVLQGTASFATQGKVLTVANSHGAVIQWGSFNIAADETTRFIQASASSQVLNRIASGIPSQILGNLQSNGQVFLINPSGVIFGPGSQVDVAALAVSSLKLSDTDFAAGRLAFGEASSTVNALAGPIKMQGTIRTSSSGFVYIVAPQVENSGLIDSPEGNVLLAAGHRVTIVDPRNPEIVWEVGAPQASALNLGQLTARQVGMYGMGASNTGAISANTALVGEDGRIVLKAEKPLQAVQTGRLTARDEVIISASMGGVSIDGTVDATGPQGRVRVEAPAGAVNLMPGGSLRSSGPANAIVLQTSGGLRNDAGPAALSAPNGRWLVHQDAPSADQSALGGLSAAFIHYGLSTQQASTYQGPGAGNGLTYAMAPAVSVSLKGPISKAYDQTAAAPVTPDHLSLSGVVAGDTLNVAVTAASFDDRNVGVSKAVNASLEIAGASRGTVPVFGYTLSSPLVNATVGSISARSLTISGITVADKIYDGNTIATPQTGNLVNSGLIEGDVVSLTITGAFDNRNAGANKSVNLQASLSGADATNYTLLAQSQATANVLPAPLQISAITDSKVYDGSTRSSLAPVVAGQLRPGDQLLASQVFASKNVRGQGSSLLQPSYVLLDGNGGRNYAITENTAVGTITPRETSVSGILVKDKIYDGATAAAFDVSRANLSAVIAGDNVAVVAAGIYDTAAVGSGKTATFTASLTGPDAANYRLTGRSGTVAGSITPAQVTLSGMTILDKVYDGTTSATLAPGGIVLSGVVLGDTTRLSAGQLLAAFADKSVGSAKPVTVSGLALSGPNAANYTLVAPTGLTASITPRPLNIAFNVNSKIYDGTTSALVAATDNRVTGDRLVIDFGARFDDPDVGMGKMVLINGLAISGKDAANYSLSSVGAARGDITARPLSLWTATGSGRWSDPANWDVMPVGSNVAAVSIPARQDLEVTFDAGATGATLQTLSLGATLNVVGQGLQFAQLENSGRLVIGSGAQWSPSAGFRASGTGSVTNLGRVHLTDARVDNRFTNAGTLEVGGLSSLTSIENSGELAVLDGTLNLSSSLVQTGGRTRLVPPTVGSAGSTIIAPAGVTIDGGSLAGVGRLVGTVQVGQATITPGASPGALAITGDLRLSASSTLELELGGIAQTAIDGLRVTGNTSLDGRVQVSSYGGFLPSTSDRFIVLETGSFSGRLARISTNDERLGDLNFALLQVRTPDGVFSLPADNQPLPATIQVAENSIQAVNSSLTANLPVFSSTSTPLVPPTYVEASAPLPPASLDTTTNATTAISAPGVEPSGASSATLSSATSTPTASLAASTSALAAPAPSAGPTPPPVVPVVRSTVKSLDLDPAPAAPAPTTTARKETSEVSYAKPPAAADAKDKGKGC